MRIKLIGILALLFASPAQAGEVDVLDVEVQKRDNDTYSFSVTVEHADDGWEHYADKWDVVDPDGNVLATRVLAHPHVNEQPFTRSLSGVKIPAGTEFVTIRSHDSVHEYGGKELRVEIK